MRISLLQCFSVDTSRSREWKRRRIWLIGTTFQPQESHPFSVKITFPFSQAAHVTRRGKEASLIALPFLSLPSLYSARVPGYFPAHLRASYEESSHNGGGVGDSDTNFRRSAVLPSLISNIPSSRNEEFRPRNSPLHASPLPSRLPHAQT